MWCVGSSEILNAFLQMEDEVWNIRDWAVSPYDWVSSANKWYWILWDGENTGSILCIGNELSRSETGTLWNARTKGNRCRLGRVGGEILIPVGQVRLKPSLAPGKVTVGLASDWGSDYVHRSVKITAKLRSPIGDSRCAVKITDRWFQL